MQMMGILGHVQNLPDGKRWEEERREEERREEKRSEWKSRQRSDDGVCEYVDGTTVGLAKKGRMRTKKYYHKEEDIRESNITQL